jgi:hypothetical protein
MSKALDLNTIQRQATNITLKDTTGVECDECKNTTFNEALVMRRVSRILTGAPKDSYIPIPVFLCSSCGHLNDEFLPAELKPTAAPGLVAK